MFQALVLSLAALEMSLQIPGGGALRDSGINISKALPYHLWHIIGCEPELYSVAVAILTNTGTEYQRWSLYSLNLVEQNLVLYMLRQF